MANVTPSSSNQMPEKYLRLAEVLDLVPVSRSTIYRWVKAGIFPAPITFLGTRTVAWRRSEVLAWMARLRGQGDRT